jgi:hypothetical protein
LPYIAFVMLDSKREEELTKELRLAKGLSGSHEKVVIALK